MRDFPQKETLSSVEGFLGGEPLGLLPYERLSLLRRKPSSPVEGCPGDVNIELSTM